MDLRMLLNEAKQLKDDEVAAYRTMRQELGVELDQLQQTAGSLEAAVVEQEQRVHERRAPLDVPDAGQGRTDMHPTLFAASAFRKRLSLASGLVEEMDAPKTEAELLEDEMLAVRLATGLSDERDISERFNSRTQLTSSLDEQLDMLQNQRNRLLSKRDSLRIEVEGLKYQRDQDELAAESGADDSAGASAPPAPPPPTRAPPLTSPRSRARAWP